jgi:hypothetical protein
LAAADAIPCRPLLEGRVSSRGCRPRCCRSSAVRLDDAEVRDYADRDGFYVVANLHVPDGVDAISVRNALAVQSTQTAGLGRIADVRGSRSIVVLDFAPVVASMKRAIDSLPRPKAAPSID